MNGHDRACGGLLEGSLVGVDESEAIVFFTTVLPQFTDPAQGTVGLQVAVLGLVFCTLAAVMDAGWAFGAGRARDWFATSPRRLRRLGGAGGLTMIGLGIGQRDEAAGQPGGAARRRHRRRGARGPGLGGCAPHGGVGAAVDGARRRPRRARRGRHRGGATR